MVATTWLIDLATVVAPTFVLALVFAERFTFTLDAQGHPSFRPIDGARIDQLTETLSWTRSIGRTLFVLSGGALWTVIILFAVLVALAFVVGPFHLGLPTLGRRLVTYWSTGHPVSAMTATFATVQQAGPVSPRRGPQGELPPVKPATGFGRRPLPRDLPPLVQHGPPPGPQTDRFPEPAIDLVSMIEPPARPEPAPAPAQAPLAQSRTYDPRWSAEWATWLYFEPTSRRWMRWDPAITGWLTIDVPAPPPRPAAVGADLGA